MSTEEAGSVSEDDSGAAGSLESHNEREEGEDVEAGALMSLAGEEERAGRTGDRCELESATMGAAAGSSGTPGARVERHRVRVVCIVDFACGCGRAGAGGSGRGGQE